MKYINVLKKTDDRLDVEFIGDDHSLSNLLKDLLIKSDKVSIASYDIEHPVLDPETNRYISNPKLTIITKEGNDPVEVLKEALREVIKLCDECSKSL